MILGKATVPTRDANNGASLSRWSTCSGDETWGARPEQPRWRAAGRRPR